jgi:hypothetical protein
MEKIILSTDQQSINSFLENVANCVIKLNQAQEVKQKHKVETSSELIEKYKKKSGFSNIEMVIKGYELEEDLALLKYSESDLNLLLKYIETEGSLFVLTVDAEERIKEKFTTYLSDEDTIKYNKLKKICTLLDEAGTSNRYIQPTPTGWKVNIIALHSKL